MFSGLCQRFARFFVYMVWTEYCFMNKSRKFAALIIIAVILSALPGKVSAQETDDEEQHGLYIEQQKVFYGGIVAGANFAQIDGDYFAGYHKVGFNAGPIVYAQLAKHLALSLEILYSQKGSRSSIGKLSPYNSGVYILKYGINVNYAEIPIMINYFDSRRSHFGAGFSYSRLVSSTETITVYSLRNIKTIDFNSNYPFKKDAFDFIVGADLHLWKGLFLNVRFQYSLLPVRTVLPPPTYARADQYSNLWTVRLMYLVK
jgi:hypothetical protein